ncbi:Forkhead box protein D2 [Marasmius sp. AFHP31]|nr:Forkhead box protein D2 [Marasmius sp. AFHP31]
MSPGMQAARRMSSRGWDASQHRQKIVANYYGPSARAGTLPRAVPYPGHPYSPRPATGALHIARDDQMREPVLGLDISVEQVDNQFRELYDISPNRPVDLNAVPDPPGPLFTQGVIIQLAIWSSKGRKLTQAEIWQRIERRFPSVRDREKAKWKKNMRHLLSLKKVFVKLPELSNGAHYWKLDYGYLEAGGDRRVRKRGAKKNCDALDARSQHQSDDEYDTEEFQGDLYLNSSSSLLPSSGTGGLDRYEQVPSGYPFNPSQHPAFPQRISSGGSQYSRPAEKYPPASHAPHQPCRNRTYLPVQFPEPVFGQSSFTPNHRSSNFEKYQ